MLRTVFTLGLIVAALGLALTSHGLALFGSNRRVVVAAFTVLGVLQVYRLISAMQAKKRDDLLKKIPKRPLGI
jgi:hypothetical protein